MTRLQSQSQRVGLLKRRWVLEATRSLRTADELLDNAIADAKKKAGRVKTPERTRKAVEDRPQLLASPDPLMQPYEANLEQVVPVQVTMNNHRPAVERSVETDSEMSDDLENDLMSNTRPAANGEDTETFEVSKRQRQECLACNEAAARMRHDRNVTVSLEQRLRATDEQVAIMKVRADAAEERIVDYTNELTPNPPTKSSRFWDLGATTLK